jgi:hypothetical protein
LDSTEQWEKYIHDMRGAKMATRKDKSTPAADGLHAELEADDVEDLDETLEVIPYCG